MIPILAGAAAALFVVMIVFLSMKQEMIGEYVGVVFHLLLFPVIAALPADEWARAAGFGWIIIDTAIGVAAINGVSQTLVWPLRLGSHVLGAMWIVSAALAMTFWPSAIGIVLAVIMGGYSFVAPWVDRAFFMPSGALMVIWLGWIAATYPA